MCLSLGLLDGILGNANGVCSALLHINGNANLLAQNTQLLHSSRTEGIAGSQEGIHVTLLLEHLGQLTTHGGLTGTVQTCHQDDSGMAFELHIGGLASHQGSQLVVHNLNHQLLGLNSCEHILAQGFLLDGIGKILGYLIVDVGIQQGTTYILQRFGNVNLGYLAFTLQYLKGPFESLT